MKPLVISVPLCEAYGPVFCFEVLAIMLNKPEGGYGFEVLEMTSEPEDGGSMFLRNVIY
jgi:hypothetical protein